MSPEKVKEDVFCPWCGNYSLIPEIVRVDSDTIKIHFKCNVCKMEWDGPLEKEKRYLHGVRPSEETIRYYIDKMITQDYVDESTRKNQ